MRPTCFVLKRFIYIVYCDKYYNFMGTNILKFLPNNINNTNTTERVTNVTPMPKGFCQEKSQVIFLIQ